MAAFITNPTNDREGFRPLPPVTIEPPDGEDVPPAMALRQPRSRHGVMPPWVRGIVVLVAYVCIQVLGAVVVVAAMTLLSPAAKPDEVGRSLPVLAVTTVLGILTLLAAWQWLDRQGFAALGHPGPPGRVGMNLVGGLVGGIALMGIVVGVGTWLGAWTVSFGGPIVPLPVVGWSVLLVGAAYVEELLMRGYLLQNFGRRAPWIGLTVTSLLFAVLHLGNPGVSSGVPGQELLISLDIAGAGFLLGAVFLLSRDLWLPTGLHVGWNWAQGVLFGLPVSGLVVPSIGHAVRSEPSLVGGSSFGPESSLIAVVAVFVIAIPLTIVVLRRGRLVPAEEELRQMARPPETGLPLAPSEDAPAPLV
jgi:membrane protease YdiL (CAAX protease family)